MAKDSNGNVIGLGDYVIKAPHIVSVIELKESPKASTMKGAVIGFDAAGRLKIVRMPMNPLDCTLIMRADGTLVLP